mgnify:FL=1
MSRTAYSRLLPKDIINKEKTGWTVPVGLWLTMRKDAELEEFYVSRLGKDKLNAVSTSQKSAKLLIPDLTLQDWKKIYKVQ